MADEGTTTPMDVSSSSSTLPTTASPLASTPVPPSAASSTTSLTTAADPEIADFVLIDRTEATNAAVSSSSTDSTDAKEALTETEERRRYPKRKVALILGYCGTGFKGMQRNPGVETIEDVLEQAIYRAGGMIKENLGSLQKINWQRCARTDKGVHAISQVVSLKMIVEPEGIIERMNELLPPQIRIFAMKRAAGSFNAKSFCDSRTYEYIMPTYAFSPSQKRHPELCNEPFVFDSAMRQTVNSVLAFYVGTHNFHNFTAKLDAKEAKATRFMKAFSCSEAFNMDGIEYVRLEVTGSSFLLHQIRKMIGFAVALIRDRAEISKVKEMMIASFSKKRLMIPMAPGLGLMLQTVYFAGYNKKFSKSHDTIDMADYKDVMKQFQLEHIYPRIVKQEKEERETKKWIDTLEEFPLDYDTFLTNKVAQSGKRRRTMDSKGTESSSSTSVITTTTTTATTTETTESPLTKTEATPDLTGPSVKPPSTSIPQEASSS